MILLELEPEYVGIITLKNHDNNDIFSLSIQIGHTLGNLHRPIQVTKNGVVFPLQAETELEMLTKVFSPFVKSIDIKTDHKIFEPEEGHHNHEH
jgi:urease accessory protein